MIHYTKAISFEPTSVHFNNRGLTNYYFEKYEDAKDDFDKALERDVTDPTIYFNRGNVYLNWKENQNYEAAHLDYDKALQIAPNNPKLWHAKGLAFQGQAEKLFQETHIYDQNLNRQAIEMYEYALKLNDKFISSRFHLGLMFHRLSQFQDALKCFSQVLEKIHDDQSIYIARGAVYQDMSNHQLAIKDFDKSIELD